MWIDNYKLQDFLAVNGFEPVMETSTEAFYNNSKELRNLLTSYFIKYKCIPNRLGS